MIQFGIALVILIAISVFWRYSAMVITGILCSKGYEASSANYFFSFLWDWSVFQKFDELIDSETSVKDEEVQSGSNGNPGDRSYACSSSCILHLFVSQSNKVRDMDTVTNYLILAAGVAMLASAITGRGWYRKEWLELFGRTTCRIWTGITGTILVAWLIYMFIRISAAQ